jgi:hypothetical protein
VNKGEIQDAVKAGLVDSLGKMATIMVMAIEAGDSDDAVTARFKVGLKAHMRACTNMSIAIDQEFKA